MSKAYKCDICGTFTEDENIVKNFYVGTLIVKETLIGKDLRKSSPNLDKEHVCLNCVGKIHNAVAKVVREIQGTPTQDSDFCSHEDLNLKYVINAPGRPNEAIRCGNCAGSLWVHDSKNRVYTCASPGCDEKGSVGDYVEVRSHSCRNKTCAVMVPHGDIKCHKCGAEQ